MRYTLGAATLLLAYQGDALVGCVGVEVMAFEAVDAIFCL